MSLLRLLLRLLFAALVLAVLAGAALYFIRPGMEQYRAHAYSATPASTATGAALTATWFGTTALLLSDGEHAVMVDPFFTRPEGLLNLALNREIAPGEALIAESLARAGIQKLDAVLVSHSHYDHAMDAGVVARLTGAVLLGSESTANVGRGSGLPETQIRVIKPGEKISAGSFSISFIESRHAGATGGTPTGNITQPLRTPARYLDYKLGGAYSILIEHAQGAVLHHGSANFLPGALKDVRADVVFLGIALIDDLDVYLREVVEAVGAKRIIPTHWDDFSRPLRSPLRPFPAMVRLDKFFEQMAAHPDIAVQTLEAGQRAILFNQ